MDLKKQVTLWVENKIGNNIYEDLNKKILTENTFFNTEVYASELINSYFSDVNIENIKNEVLNFGYSVSVNTRKSDLCNYPLVKTDSIDSLELEASEANLITLEDVVTNLKNGSEELKSKFLKTLEISAEDLITPVSWSEIIKILQHLLKSEKSRKIRISALKVFEKLMSCDKPFLVSESFTALTEIVYYHIKLVNSKNEETSIKKINILKEGKNFVKNNVIFSPKRRKDSMLRDQESLDAEVLIKSMWLLIQCQKQKSHGWIHFNDKRLCEIIHSFIYLISSTTNAENKVFSGLELLSILNPSANWFRYWCHSTVGRSMVCAAIRKYKNFFIQVTEIILIQVKKEMNLSLQSFGLKYDNKADGKKNTTLVDVQKALDTSKACQTENCECDYSYEIKQQNHVASIKYNGKIENAIKRDNNSTLKKVFKIVPQKIVHQAVLWHCMSIVVFLTQFRNGRSLFPVQTCLFKRLITAQELTRSIYHYLQYMKLNSGEFDFTQKGGYELLKMIGSLNFLENVHRY